MNEKRILLFGALIGAFTGLAAAMLLNRRAEKTGTEVTLNAGDGMKIGMLVFGLLRAISALGDDRQ